MKNKMPFVEKHIVATMLIFTFFGLLLPSYFAWAKNLTYPLLTLIAFCVGLTLKPTHFKSVWQNKKLIIPVLSFKYVFAPLITYSVCMFLHIPLIYTIGLVTLTCCPAANTGNIMCYLSKGNTAMIIITTITGALLAPLVTPTIIYILLHKVVHVQFSDILFVIATGITIPMAIGIFISHYFSKVITPLKPAIPSIGILAVSLIIATILSKHAGEILNIGVKIPMLCAALILIFLTLGFLFSKTIKCSLENCIAMSYEVGTFDGVLGILLTTQIVGSSATLPVVIFAVLNLVIGSIASKIFTAPKFVEMTRCQTN